MGRPPPFVSTVPVEQKECPHCKAYVPRPGAVPVSLSYAHQGVARMGLTPQVPWTAAKTMPTMSMASRKELTGKYFVPKFGGREAVIRHPRVRMRRRESRDRTIRSLSIYTILRLSSVRR